MKNKILPVRNASAKFQSFETMAAKLGFSRISSEREKRDLKMQNVVPPKSRRLRGLAGQVILEKQIDDYTIRVVTTYNPNTNTFSFNGKLWVRIVAIDPKTGREPGVFTWKTTRVGDFLGRALLMMKFLVVSLENRPHDGRGKLLTLESRVGVDKYNPYVWVGKYQTGKVLTMNNFVKPHPDPTNPVFADWGKVMAFIYDWIRDVWYYETRRRIVRGYKRRERDVRLKYTIVRKRAKTLL